MIKKYSLILVLLLFGCPFIFADPSDSDVKGIVTSADGDPMVFVANANSRCRFGANIIISSVWQYVSYEFAPNFISKSSNYHGKITN